MPIPAPARLVRRFVTGGALGVADELRPEFEDEARNMAGHVVALAAGGLAALITRKIVKTLWTAITGTEEPDPTDPQTPWSVAIGWTVAIGVGASVGGLVGRRLAAQQVEKTLAK